ncbi:MAG: CinA family protein [Bifidobacteriaceae bacterium]|jgi:nicotinamide-nucleotide amidase|nr:CinA family protein [Bifidobacteriaceae bacterium]MCI1915080.1 CinA family protein [Bifidobacteriaceae bacterium]
MSENLAAQILTACAQRGFYLACAESLTGGLLSDAFVSVPGASAVFLGSAVTYHLGAKNHLLGVDATVLESEGAVDPRVALQMAAGTAKLYSTAVPSDRVVGISTTGVAGPDSDGFKPVGLVYVGVKIPDEEPQVRELHLQGERQQIRRAAVDEALKFTVARLLTSVDASRV